MSCASSAKPAPFQWAKAGEFTALRLSWFTALMCRASPLRSFKLCMNSPVLSRAKTGWFFISALFFGFASAKLRWPIIVEDFHRSNTCAKLPVENILNTSTQSCRGLNFVLLIRDNTVTPNGVFIFTNGNVLVKDETEVTMEFRHRSAFFAFFHLERWTWM